MNFTSHLTRSERIERIGQILAKGVGLLLARNAEKLRLAESPTSTCAADQPRLHSQDQHEAGGAIVLDDQEQRILEYLKRVNTASPREMQSCLGLSKATLFRRLKRLLEARLVVSSGSTTASPIRIDEIERSLRVTKRSVAANYPGRAGPPRRAPARLH
jgi:DNA-binding MarR family transcriptional regulator